MLSYYYSKILASLELKRSLNLVYTYLSKRALISISIISIPFILAIYFL